MASFTCKTQHSFQTVFLLFQFKRVKLLGHTLYNWSAVRFIQFLDVGVCSILVVIH